MLNREMLCLMLSILARFSDESWLERTTVSSVSSSASTSSEEPKRPDDWAVAIGATSGNGSVGISSSSEESLESELSNWSTVDKMGAEGGLLISVQPAV